MKIKTKKEMTLPELIEWGIKNGITSKEYTCDNNDGYKSVIFDIGGKVHLNRFQTYLADDKYEVETEEQITEDTVIPKLMVKFKSPSRYQVFSNDYINGFEVEEGNIEAFYIMNEDLTMTLIWTKEKGLIE